MQFILVIFINVTISVIFYLHCIDDVCNETLLYRPNRYTAITMLAIVAVFVEYLRQFVIDLNQIYRHSSVPKNTSLCIFPAS